MHSLQVYMKLFDKPEFIGVKIVTFVTELWFT